MESPPSEATLTHDLSLPVAVPVAAHGGLTWVSSGQFRVPAQLSVDGLIRERGPVCAELAAAEPRSIRHLWCAHGMGHGYLDLLDRDVPAALTACDRLPDWDAQHCYGGVFMENVTSVVDGPSPFLHPDDPLYPCPAVADRQKAKCYEKQTAYPLFRYDGDLTPVFAPCAAAPDVAFRPACYRGLGDRAVVRSEKLLITGGTRPPPSPGCAASGRIRRRAPSACSARSTRSCGTASATASPTSCAPLPTRTSGSPAPAPEPPGSASTGPPGEISARGGGHGSPEDRPRHLFCAGLDPNVRVRENGSV